MPTYDGEELIARFVALEKEAVTFATGQTAEAFPQWMVMSEFTPYWRNAIARIGVEYAADDMGDEGQVYPVTVAAQLVLGATTEGMTNEIDERLHLALPKLIQYFDERRNLQSAAYPAAMTWLSPNGMQFEDASFQPKLVLANGGAGIGVDFRFRCEFVVPLTQQYLG